MVKVIVAKEDGTVLDEIRIPEDAYTPKPPEMVSNEIRSLIEGEFDIDYEE